ncbi:hypothetical protein BD770DRAFT_447431 [Pilaira anomala]|nr:hypothetical protein BD770DRAFT_447431 [Pilaira anomala]
MDYKYRTNVVPDEGGPSWGCILRYGEAKVAEANPNIASLANDHLRLAKAVHESHLKVDGTQKIPDSQFYTMTEIFEMVFSRSMQELGSFKSRKNIESLISL